MDYQTQRENLISKQLTLASARKFVPMGHAIWGDTGASDVEFRENPNLMEMFSRSSEIHHIYKKQKYDDSNTKQKTAQ